MGVARSYTLKVVTDNLANLQIGVTRPAILDFKCTTVLLRVLVGGTPSKQMLHDESRQGQIN
jgi:hypothetical protein